MEKTLQSKQIAKIVNISSVFLVPMLGYPWFWYGEYLVNGFRGDAKYPEKKDRIFVLLSFANTDQYRKIEDTLRKHKNYELDYDVGPDLVMFCFTIPEEYAKDYDLFKQGKYSHFSVKLKDSVLGSGTYGKTYEVLTRASSLRQRMEQRLDTPISEDAELLDPPDNPKKEIFGY